MTLVPHDPAFDNTFALLSEGYLFISNRCRRLGTDIFQTRLMLRRATCMMGEAAAELFHAPDRFTRRGATPKTTLALLQGEGSVQTLDGPDHRHRKRMFMSLMTPDRIRELVDAMEREWRRRLPLWSHRPEVTLSDEIEEILCQAVCVWAGIRLDEHELHARTRELTAMISGSGSVGPRNWKGQFLRSRTERWVRDLLGQVRAGQTEAPPGSALRIVASHRDPDGELLDERSAALELINFLRPTVATARYIVFSAHALHTHPEYRDQLRATNGCEEEAFVQEVRRHYPFFPFVGGLVRAPFDWRGHTFQEGDWVLLDLYGTNHDPRLWQDPERFRPERFVAKTPRAAELVPQGGGDHHDGHRCAGEWLTIALMKSALRLLTREMDFVVPAQDLTIDLSRVPARPASRFVISDVRPVG